MVDSVKTIQQCGTKTLLFSMDTPFANTQAALSSLGGTGMVLAFV
jgi:hypothetical protein